MGDIGKLVFADPQLLSEDGPVALGLGQQDQKIRIVQNGLNRPACQQVVG